LIRVLIVRSLRLTAALLATFAAALAFAPAALAADGLGWAGRVSDKTITFAMFGVIAFFPILVITLAIIQGRLDARKERRRSDLQRLG
jgi:hypothetical protein